MAEPGSHAAFAAAAPELADAARRLLVGADGVAIGFLATARVPEVADLRATGRFVLHAFLGANDEELQLGGTAAEVEKAEEREAVHEAIPFGSFDRADPIFRLAIERALWVFWERVGQSDTRPVRRRWVGSGS